MLWMDSEDFLEDMLDLVISLICMVVLGIIGALVTILVITFGIFAAIVLGFLFICSVVDDWLDYMFGC